jgi:AAA domain/Bifunctional DNA primase/polymerase, N-terminal
MATQRRSYTEDGENSSPEEPEEAKNLPLLDEALAYAAQNIRIVPCGPDKKALHRDWRKIATTRPDEIRHYFGSGSENLLAIVPADAKRAILNVPYDRIREDWIAHLPSTLIVEPPGQGRHVHLNTSVNFGPGAYYRGCKVISEGYVIVPPSPGWTTHDDCDVAPMPRGMEAALRAQAIPCRTLGEYLTHNFPPVKTMLGLWLLERGSTMLCGRAGLGKTWASLGITIALATGTSFLGWRVEGGPRRILYIDGEMPAEKMQERYRAMLTPLTPAQRKLALSNIRIISHVDAPSGIPSLGDSTSGGRELIEAWAEDHQADLVILDNLSALATIAGKSENDDTSWQEMRDWIGRLMRRGHSVLIIHHTGKPNPLTGETTQRGTSKREDGLDSSIILSRKANEGPVSWKFTKHRHNDGTDPMTLDIVLDVNCWFARVEEGEEPLDPLEEQVVAAKRLDPALSENELVSMFRGEFGERCNKPKVHRILVKHGLNGKQAAGSEEEVRDDA